MQALSRTEPVPPQVVVVVDDDGSVRGSLESFLRSAGIAVRGFPDAESFLDDPLSDVVPCVVTDLHMPGLGGLALQSELRRRHLDTAIIVMTAYPSEIARETAVAGGAAAFMTKPLDLEHLLDVVEGALRVVD